MVKRRLRQRRKTVKGKNAGSDRQLRLEQKVGDEVTQGRKEKYASYHRHTQTAHRAFTQRKRGLT